MDTATGFELQKIEQAVKEVDAKVTGIRAFLSGNELDKDDKGMVGQMNDVLQRVTTLEKWKDRIFYVMIGMALPAGIGTWELVKKIFQT